MTTPDPTTDPNAAGAGTPTPPDAETRVKALIDESVTEAVKNAIAPLLAAGKSAPRRTQEPAKKSIFQTLFGDYSA